MVNNTGPEYLTKCFMNVIKSYAGRSVVFPAGYFFPFSANERNLDYEIDKNFSGLKHMQYTIGKDHGQDDCASTI